MHHHKPRPPRARAKPADDDIAIRYLIGLVSALLFVAAALIVFALPAFSATITSSTVAPIGGVKITLDAADFRASGGPGSGGSVIGDPFNVSTKDETSPAPYGRYDPLGGTWIDSNDNPDVVWNLSYAKPITSVSFALTDAFDQNPNKNFGGKSFFNLSVEGAKWSIDKQEANGTLHWITVLFDDPTDSAALAFSTRLNDGWGVSQASVAPVPLPAAAWLLIAGVGALYAVRRRRAAA